MRFSWTGLILAPMLAPLVFCAAMLGFSQADVSSLPVLLILGCVVSYATTIFLFLPSLFLLSLWRPMTGIMVCLLGLVLGAAAFVLLTGMTWMSSGPDSGPPTENPLVFFLRWTADPIAAAFPPAGLMTAGVYWWLGTWRRGRVAP
jgi:hypothetical protein